MRFIITPATIIAIWACSAAQAQNAPKACDAECVQRLQQSLSDLQQRVRALEQASEDRLTTGSVGLPVVPVAPADTGPDNYWQTYVTNPPTLTPYVSALSCQRHEQIVTVPSEDGGTRQVNVRRC
jgi:phospholipase/lecithinase/hemolysin